MTAAPEVLESALSRTKGTKSLLGRSNNRLSHDAVCSRFTTEAGCEETFVVCTATGGKSCAAALDDLETAYAATLRDRGLSDATAVFSRLFVSDYVNQKNTLEASPLVKRLRGAACSIIEQKPVGSGPVSLFSWHLRGGAGAALARTSALDGSGALVSGENYRLLLTANYADDGAFDSYRQTKTIFASLNAAIGNNGMTLLGNAIRSWIFVHDVDNHYAGFVKARREYFAEQGLTDKTRYLASTGIEGSGPSSSQLVTVDSLSIGGIAPDQIVRMEALTHLSPTILYGVTFERGLRVRFGDRSHLYISGTASINDKGEVLHIGDVENQTRRTFENLRALLREHHATPADMMYLIVYVRNFHEWELVRPVIEHEIGPRVPLVAVESKVCRPTWLFELEGVAIIPDAAPYPAFC